MTKARIWCEVICNSCGGMAAASGYYSPETIKRLKAETKDWKRDYFYGNLCPECQAKLAELKGE